MSDAGNRDDSLERLLRKARPMLGGSGTPEACLDAETVAAWAAGGLADDELERAQMHTAGCTRCQSLVAMMVRIDPAVAVDEVPAPSSRAWIGWLVPLAAAAGVTLFVLMRAPGSAPESPLASVVPASPSAASPDADRLAQAQPAPPAPTPQPSAAREATTDQKADLQKQAAVRQEAERREAAPVVPSLAREARAADATMAARASENRTFAVGQAGSTMGGVAGGIAQQAQTVNIQAPPAPAPVVVAQAPLPVATPPPAAAGAIAPPPPAPAPAPPASVSMMAESVTVAAPPSSAKVSTVAASGGAGRGGSAGGRGGGAGRGGAPVALDGVAAVELGTVVVAPPNSMVRWRATGALVERSTDAGATWQFLARVVDANFRAASTPSPLVCWLVGRDGVVVVFTEGRTARAVTFPELVHLTSVVATDERTVTVTTINGREYSTTDGGLSWNVR